MPSPGGGGHITGSLSLIRLLRCFNNLYSILNPNNLSPIIQFKKVRFVCVGLEGALFLAFQEVYLFRAPVAALPPFARSLPADLIKHLVHITLPLSGVGINLGLKGAFRDFFRLLVNDLLVLAALILFATFEQGQVALCMSMVLLFELNRPAVEPGTMRETLLLL
jgi:hypothetical protein